MANLYLASVVFASIVCVINATSPTIPPPPPRPERTFCPKDDSFKDFDIKKILGDWRIIETSTTAPPAVRGPIKPIECQMFNIKENGNTCLLTHQLGVGPAKYVNKYNIIDEDRHLVQQTHAPIEEIMFAVPVTDYENFALVITCEQNFNFHRTAHILIKDPNSKSKKDYVEKAHASLRANNFDVEAMQEVSQEKCD